MKPPTLYAIVLEDGIAVRKAAIGPDQLPDGTYVDPVAPVGAMLVTLPEYRTVQVGWTWAAGPGWQPPAQTEAVAPRERIARLEAKAHALRAKLQTVETDLAVLTGRMDTAQPIILNTRQRVTALESALTALTARVTALEGP